MQNVSDIEIERGTPIAKYLQTEYWNSSNICSKYIFFILHSLNSQKKRNVATHIQNIPCFSCLSHLL